MGKSLWSIGVAFLVAAQVQYAAANTGSSTVQLPQRAPPELSKPIPRVNDPAEWKRLVRDKIRKMVEGRVEDSIAWRILRTDAVVGAPRAVPNAERDALLAEVNEARAVVQSSRLLDELASGPTRVSEGGLGRVIWVVQSALSSSWPQPTKLKVTNAALEKANAILRPELTAAAALAQDLPASLDGLKQARAALRPIEEYRGSMEKYFGTIDPEKILTPLWLRIAEIEAKPSVSDELRAALAAARRQKDPRAATEKLLFEALGPNPSGSKLGHLVPEARDLAALAAITIQDQVPPSSDRSEPTVYEIAAFAHQRVALGNAKMAAERAKCRQGTYADPVEAVLCLPAATVGAYGGLELRLIRIAKRGCIAEVAGERYRCSFLQDAQVYFPGGRTPSPGAADAVRNRYLPGSGIVEARFVRILDQQGEPTWRVFWGGRG